MHESFVRILPMQLRADNLFSIALILSVKQAAEQMLQGIFALTSSSSIQICNVIKDCQDYFSFIQLSVAKNSFDTCTLFENCLK